MEMSSTGAPLNTYANGPSGLLERFQHTNSGVPYVLYLFDPNGSLVHRVRSIDPNTSSGAAVFVQDTAVYDSQGLLHADIDTLSGGFNSGHLDPVGYKGELGNYTDLETQRSVSGLYTALSGPGGVLYYDPLSGVAMARSEAARVNEYANNVNAVEPALPASATDRDGQIDSLSYDTGNHYGNVSSISSSLMTASNAPGHAVTTMQYDYSDFALGQISSTQESHVADATGAADATKTPTTITYYKASDGFPNLVGLVKTVNTPAPGTAGSGSTVPTTFTYDSLGNVLTMTSPGPNGTTTTTYNYTTYTLGNYTYTQAEALGQPVHVSVSGPASSGGTTTTDMYYEYNTSGYNTGQVKASTDALGNRTDFLYNIAGQPLQVLAPATNTSTPTARASSVTTYEYVGGPASAEQTLDESGTAVREVDTAYDAEGQVRGVTGSTQPTFYTYDAHGRVATLKDGNNNVTTYSYDPASNLQKLFYPGWTRMSDPRDSESYTYDPDHNPVSKMDGRGIVTRYARRNAGHFTDGYDSLVTQMAYSNLPSGVTAIASVGYSYDAFGRRSLMTDGTGTTAYPAYDDLDDLLSVTKSFTGGPQNQTLAYAYNPDGSRLSLTWPANVTNGVGGVNLGKTNYAYDGVGRLTQSKFPWASGVWNHSYLSNGWLSRTNGPAALNSAYPLVQSQYFYNGRGFLTTLEDNSAYKDAYYGDTQQYGPAYTAMAYDALGNRQGEKASLPQISYFYSANGNPFPRSRAQDASHSISYGYDIGHSSAAQNRDVMTGEMSAVSGSGTSVFNNAYTHGFGYDAAYNPVTYGFWNGASDTAASLPANADNQLAITGINFDGSGNPTTYQNATFSFDPEDRLTGMNSPAFSAAYDGDGLRATKTAGGTTTYFLYDGDSPVAEETYSGTSATFSALNGWTADGWRARYVNNESQAYDFLYDPQGNLVQRQTVGGYSASVAAVDETFYEGYGALRQDYDVLRGGGTPPHKDPVGFGGQFGYYTDTETGLLCLTHRYCDPGTGKFINRDPIGYGGGANLYAFCGGNPVNESDPSGDAPEDAKPGSNPFVSEDIQDVEQAIAEGLEARAEREAEEKQGSLGRSLELQSYLRSSRFSDPKNAPTFRYSFKYVANGRINTWLVRFTQDSVDWPFKNPNYNIGDTALALRKGTLTPEDLEPIRIFEKNGQLFSLDNRRLLTFRSAGKDPYFLLEDYNDPAIQRELYSRKNGRQPKFSTTNGGMSVLVKKFPH